VQVGVHLMAGLQFERAQPISRTTKTREISHRAVVQLDTRPIHEAERGLEIRADHLVGDVAVPRFIRVVETDAVGIIVPGRVGEAPLIVEIRHHRLAGNRHGVAIIEIDTGNGVARESRRIAVGEDEAEP
jgi:hypothetical protein